LRYQTKALAYFYSPHISKLPISDTEIELTCYWLDKIPSDSDDSSGITSALELFIPENVMNQV
jgi:hypothetical protein